MWFTNNQYNMYQKICVSVTKLYRSKRLRLFIRLISDVMFTYACQQFFKWPSCEYDTVFVKVPNLNLNITWLLTNNNTWQWCDTALSTRVTRNYTILPNKILGSVSRQWPWHWNTPEVLKVKNHHTGIINCRKSDSY